MLSKCAQCQITVAWALAKYFYIYIADGQHFHILNKTKPRLFKFWIWQWL